ncbi:hypothetical protein P170DRAFT_440504 [Aspergillus steynii IBT 23096]|uniref:ER-bound oxygenase mpaB/mpaB'/Rubber oxygenase catalytic domain-containing protein n=1 Tax=Aspergillus steynii IBT 23096 TaxID=1392250 RepID=A0A2I2FU51_9EURO|nr:uncharacterized protein P170DRAFT_440504 [Aspergillus steynii IBT 23096]PLB44144.1 hypothetical protein P170DRAFT_440504 [Aspergillus steynii IBT 23096]
MSSSENSEKSSPILDNPQHIQKVVQEGLLLGGGAAAILLQVAMPGVGKGVDNHSNFSYRPLDRLRTTMTFVYCMAFGTNDEKRAVVDMVHRAHAPVKGADYDANDTRLQVWVAATLYAVGTDMYEQVFGAMDECAAERLYREYAILAVSLRVRPEEWPESRAKFWEYWDEQVESMEVTENAKNVANDLLFNYKLPLHLRVLMPWIRLVTAELLPPRIREAYGLKTTKVRRGAYRVTVGFARATYPCLPMFVRTYPKRYYMKDMRRRLQKTG